MIGSDAVAIRCIKVQFSSQGRHHHRTLVTLHRAIKRSPSKEVFDDFLAWSIAMMVLSKLIGNQLVSPGKLN